MSKQDRAASSDPRIGAAYRDLAREKTPSHIDDEVLLLARREARSPYAAARSWTRPLAWAAVVCLSVALVYEVTRIDDAPPPARDEPAAELAQPALRLQEAATPPAEACDETARATPESWYACIEALREDGKLQAAERELTELQEKFPGFEAALPDT